MAENRKVKIWKIFGNDVSKYWSKKLIMADDAASDKKKKWRGK